MSTTEEIQKQCFLKLKPFTDSLHNFSLEIIKTNSKDIASLLNNLLLTLHSIDNPYSALTATNTHYIILPLLELYRSANLEKVQGYETIIEPWLKIMNFLLSNTLIKSRMSSQFTIQLIILFTTLIDDKLPGVNTHENKKKLDISEEIKLLVVTCISATLPSQYKEGRYESFMESPYYHLTRSLQQDSFIPVASQTIMVLLNLILHEQSIELRVSSICLLSQLLLDNLRNVDILAKLMPGVVSKLCATISQKAEKENHQVVCAALKTLSSIIKAVMRDDLNDTLTVINSLEDVFNKQKVIQNNEKGKIRNKEWYLKAKESISNVLGQVLTLRIYPDWRTRIAFVKFSYTLLSACSKTLDNCVKSLIEILVLHIDDSYGEVSSTCRILIQTLASSSSFETEIVPVLKLNLYDLMMKIPNYMISRGEQEKINMMTLMSGFIILLGKNAETTLSTVLSRLSDGWLTALEIDKNSITTLEERPNQQYIDFNTEGKTMTPVYPKIRFKHIVTDETLIKFKRLIGLIGKYGDLKKWIHHFMRYIGDEDNTYTDPQAGFIIFSLLSGRLYDSGSNFEVDRWINEMDEKIKADTYLKTTATQVLFETMNILKKTSMNNSRQSSAVSASTYDLDEESGYILTVCLCLQLVGLTSCIIDKDDLEEMFITALYPLLAHLGSNNVFIHTYALITLDTMALRCGLKNAQELAINNIDYIINSISQHISLLTINIKVPQVLKALIHVGGYNSIKYMDDSVEEIFDALERYSTNEWISGQLCNVLLEVVQCLEKNQIGQKKQPLEFLLNDQEFEKANKISSEVQSLIDSFDSPKYMDKGLSSMEEIGKYFLDRQNKGLHDNLTLEQTIKEIANGNLDLPDDQSKKLDKIAEEMNKDEELPLSHEQELAKSIMDKVSHFLTASSPNLRAQVLTLLTSGISVMSDHPPQLNKLIHDMWPLIANRFDDPQSYIILNAAILVEKISEVSTDFFFDKFYKTLWPKFKLILQKGIHAAESDISATKYSVYSVCHRTQKCILKTLAQIAYHVPMKQDLVKSILEETRFYYNNNQVHQELSSGCQILFTALSTQQPDTVWLYRMSQEHLEYKSQSALLYDCEVPNWFNRK